MAEYPQSETAMLLRIEELEEALREVLEIEAGWCRPMTDAEKLGAIKETSTAALFPSEAPEKEE